MKYFKKKMLATVGGFLSAFVLLGTSLGIVAGTVKTNRAPIAVLLSSRNNPFFQQIADGINIYAKKFGYNVQYFDSENLVEKEQQHVRSIIAAGFEMVLFNDVNESSGVNAVKQFNKADIPVIAVDHILEKEQLKKNKDYQLGDDFKVVANIASDNFQAGEILAVYASQVLKIPFNSRTYTLHGIPGTISSEQRMKGFMRKVKNPDSSEGHYTLSAPAFALDDTDTSVGFTVDDNREKAFNQTTASLTTYFTPGTPNFTPILFGTNDEVAAGAIAAFDNGSKGNLLAGSKPYENNKTWVFGVDYTKDALENIKKLKQSATVRQDTHLMGYLSMDIASYYLNPKTYGNQEAYGDLNRYQKYNQTTFDYWLKRYPNRFANDQKPTDKMQDGYYFKLNTSLTYWDIAKKDYKNVSQSKDVSTNISTLTDIGPAGQLTAADTPGQPEKINFS